MSKLQQRLMRELQQNRAIQIVHTDEWSIPIRTVDVTYKPVQRSTMDVLMTMLLVSMQEIDFSTPQEFSELLLVDVLFIEDLITIMKRAGLIDQQESVYQLTVKGQQQLAQGVFEEELDEEVATLFFSPCHHAFLKVDEGRTEDYDELPELYRYLDKEAEQQFEDSQLIEALQQDEEATASSQKVIAQIVQAEAKQINDSPCLEFVLYDKEQDILYARIWNVLLHQWDHVLEQQLTAKEQLQWRERYK
ncbi:hypothetical protein [Lysinibacillus piscis]|nr:hypothetical protein [Lysinibacillus sp. KH24]